VRTASTAALLSLSQFAFASAIFTIAIIHNGDLKFLASLKNMGRKILRHLLRKTAQPAFFLTTKQNLVQESGAGRALMLNKPNSCRLPFKATMP
jgi:hypothetical protein